jgi:L-iditol 2-dehydrogenase
MKAIRFNITIPRYVIGKISEKIYTPLMWSGISCLYYADIPEPELPGPDWVKINTRLAGICASDTNTITLKTSPYFEPFSSSPFTLGHEQVGVISEVGSEVDGWRPGDRVVVEPTLWCAPRGFPRDEWCEYCLKGEPNRCANVAHGVLSPGKMIGFCTETGGSWSQTFTAHRSQLYKVPDSVSDENALLVEPFAIGLHAASQFMPNDEDTVLIIGAGTIGLMQLAALRAVGSKAHIIIATRYPFQVDAARKLGADEILNGVDPFTHIEKHNGARVYTPILGKRVMVGGVDMTFDCVGVGSTIDDALRLTRSGGRVVIVGMPGQEKGIDWSAVFDKELTITASYIYNHADVWQGGLSSTYDIALEMMASGELDLSWMISRRYPLDDYSQALKDFGNKKSHPIIKSVFEF